MFAGAGSHSGAYLAGDYLITVPAPTLGGFVRAVRWVARVLTPWSRSVADEGVGIPYVDYARGDGRVIGPGGDPWHPVVIDDTTGWVRDYRGLWGHDTHDRLGGERGPAGPRYERDGTVRQSWADPLGWAGMAKVAPNGDVEAERLVARAVEIEGRLGDLEEQIRSARLSLGLAAAGQAPASPEVRALVVEEQRVLGLRMEQARLRDEWSRVLAVAGSSTPPADPHAHLRHRRIPLTPVTGLRSRVLAGWAVISTPVVLFALGRIALPSVGVSATITAVTWLVLLLSIEGLVRGQFLRVMGRLLGVVVVLTALYYLVVDWRLVLGWSLLAAAALLLVVNLRDALRR